MVAKPRWCVQRGISHSGTSATASAMGQLWTAVFHIPPAFGLRCFAGRHSHYRAMCGAGYRHGMIVGGKRPPPQRTLGVSAPGRARPTDSSTGHRRLQRRQCHSGRNWQVVHALTPLHPDPTAIVQSARARVRNAHSALHPPHHAPYSMRQPRQIT